MADKSLTVLQVITQRHFSGAERVCLTLSEALQKRGHRLVLLCKPQDVMLNEARKRGLDVRTPGISGKLNILAPFRIKAIAREIKADIVHTHLSTAGLWGSWSARLAGIPSVAHVHALNSKNCFVFSDIMVGCSEGVRQHLLMQGVAPEKIRVIYNGLDSARFEGLDERAEVLRPLGIGDDCRLICCVGHLSEKKGQEYLIKAVAQLAGKLPSLHCLLIGEGEMRNELRRKIDELGLGDRVFLLGYRSDAMAIMNAADLVVLPSLGKEGLPLVLMEAAFLGKPVVASRLPGVDEVVEDGATGILVPPADPDALAESIDRVLGDNALRKHLGSAGQRRARKIFAVDAMAENMESLYRSLLERQGPP